MVTRPSMVGCRCGLVFSHISPAVCVPEEIESARCLYQCWRMSTATGFGLSVGLAAVEERIDRQRAVEMRPYSGRVDRRRVPLHQIRYALGFI